MITFFIFWKIASMFQSHSNTVFFSVSSLKISAMLESLGPNADSELSIPKTDSSSPLFVRFGIFLIASTFFFSALELTKLSVR